MLSGGNVDLGVVPGLIRRHETQAGRRLVVFARIDDRPGSLVRLLGAFAAAGANLVEVQHQREGVDLHVRETGVHATFEVRSREHADRCWPPSAPPATRTCAPTSAAEPRGAAGVNSPFVTQLYLLVGRLCRWTTPSLLHELEPTVEQLFDRHLATTKEWFPHEHIPYGRGRDYDARRGVDARVDADLGGSTIDDAARSSLIVNLLTEDNLPYYFRTIERQLGADGAWGAWAKRWTAEEMRHSMAIYGYLMVTRAVDPVALERSRMCQVSTGQVPEPAIAVDAIFYVALQELATRIAHRNTGPPARRRRRLRRDDARRRRREPALPLLPRPRPGGHRARPEPDDARHRAPGRRLRDAGRGHPRLRRPRRRRSPAPGSTTWRSTTTRSSCRSCCGTGASRSSPASTPTPSTPATG